MNFGQHFFSSVAYGARCTLIKAYYFYFALIVNKLSHIQKFYDDNYHNAQAFSDEEADSAFAVIWRHTSKCLNCHCGRYRRSVSESPLG